MDSGANDFAAQFLRNWTGRKQVGLVGRASTALWATLRAQGITGRWVLLPANICYIVAWAVLQSGNLPYLVDVDPLTGNLSLETLDLVQVNAPAAIVICHMYGLGAPIAQLVAWAKQRGLVVIEDATLALGAQVDERPAGAWGDVSLFSFGEGKIVDVGIGGAFLCDDLSLAQKISAELDAVPLWNPRLEQLQNQWAELYWLLHQYETENAQVTTLYPMLFQIYGEITRYQFPASRRVPLDHALSSLGANVRQRLDQTHLYDVYFRYMQVRTLARPAGSVMWRYPLLVARQDRNALLDFLWANQVPASRWYPSLAVMFTALDSTLAGQSLPGAEQLGAEIINLPVDHTSNEESIKRVAELVQTFFQAKRTHRK